MCLYYLLEMAVSYSLQEDRESIDKINYDNHPKGILNEDDTIKTFAFKILNNQYAQFFVYGVKN